MLGALNQTHKQKIITELGKEIAPRIDADPRARLIEPEDYDFVTQAIAELVMGDAEVENSGPVEALALDVAAQMVEYVRARRSEDWLLDLVLYNRCLRGQEQDPEMIADVFKSVRQMNAMKARANKRRGPRTRRLGR